jgi:nucleoid-associated protein YgaU
MEVRGGQSLSVICQQHYGSARPGIVKALATYNGLSSPDKIRKGQTLHLPGIDKLLESDRL